MFIRGLHVDYIMISKPVKSLLCIFSFVVRRFLVQKKTQQGEMSLFSDCTTNSYDRMWRDFKALSSQKLLFGAMQLYDPDSEALFVSGVKQNKTKQNGTG